ncbi:hypothetical protein [Granulicella sp. dw_53]|uniref:hypothetical protein n=1 Tax=Granulicella sp. dw_53 TaxID=2719792 RepID=UPI001BD4DF64|nr:hypothetical protein [Granulicella sp. dw_53]
MTENDIRTRAYFHFENCTGGTWQNPDANWYQAEAEEKAWATARASDISGELFTYRPLSQMIPMLVIPSINEKVANGVISATTLPIELQRLQILWPPSAPPVVQVNDEVQITVEGIARRPVKAGDPVYTTDIVPGSERLVPPTINGAPVAYLLFFSSFMDLRVYFDFSPNGPDWTPEIQRKPPYDLQEFAARTNFIQANPPKTLLTRLKQLGWPPSPTYYPSLVQTMAQPGGDTPEMVASTIIAIHGVQYWTKRIALWSELKIFSTRTPYIRKAIEEYLEGDYISAIYVAVPQFEGIINDYVRSSGGSVASKFRDNLSEFERLIESRGVLLFPRFALNLVVDFIDSGSFWNNTSTIADPRQEINRHGIAHGVFTDFEAQELALKFLILLDCVAVILLQDQMIRGVLN